MGLFSRRTPEEKAAKKAAREERIALDGLLTWTCAHCGTVIKQPPAQRTAQD